MSCRVFGRSIEYGFLKSCLRLLNVYKNGTKVYFYFKKTNKNPPAQAFLEEISVSYHKEESYECILSHKKLDKIPTDFIKEKINV